MTEQNWEEKFQNKFFHKGGVSRIIKGKRVYSPLKEEMFTPNRVKSFIRQAIKEAKQEERQFILNILNGIDDADRQIGHSCGGTKAIRFALKNRV